jgi:hypothetical protein
MNISKTNEDYIYDLLENYAFEELNAKDRSLIEQHLGAENYRLQQQILQASKTISSPKMAVKPLALPHRTHRTIPLYQAVLAVAAVITFFILIWPHAETSTRTIYKVGPTKFATNTVHDTIFQEVVREKWIYKTSENNGAITKVEEITTQPMPIFRQEELVSEKIISLKDDPIAQQFIAEMAKYER